MTSKNLPILIVGAGPTGLAAAIELTRLGKKVRIIETKKARSTYSKALGINPRTLELMDPSGTSEILIKKGRKIPGMQAIYKDRTLFSMELKNIPHKYNFMVALPQSNSEEIFEKQLKKMGVAVERETSLLEFTQDENSVTGVLDKDGKKIKFQAPYMVGADGAHSIIRKTLGLNFPGHTMREKWSLADVDLINPPSRDRVTVDLTNDRILFQIRIKGDTFRIASNKPGALDNLSKGCAAGKIYWQTDFTVSHRQVEKYQVGRIFLMGDAAHIHSPLGGRGMNLGVEDACDLADRMAHGSLENYSKVRHAAGKRVVKLVQRQTNIFCSTNPFTKFFVRSVMPHIMKRQGAKKFFLRVLSGLDLK